MANVKISELPLTLSVSPTALVPVVQNGTTCSTYACLIAAGGVNGTSGSAGTSGANGAPGANGANGTAGTSGGFGAVIIAGSGEASSVRTTVGNQAAGAYSFAGGGETNQAQAAHSFAGGGRSNQVTPGLTTSTKCFAVTANTNNSFDVTGNVTNFFQSTAVTPPAIGSSYGGGTVFYILQPGDPGYDAAFIKGYVVNSMDLSSSIVYGPETVTGATGTALGTGAANTATIKAAYGDLPYTSYAAGLAASISDGGYTDWYLPSSDELNKLYENLIPAGVGYNAYWSSTESNATDAYAQFFSYGASLPAGKINAWYVRAIRSFTIVKYTGTSPVGAEFRGEAGTSGVTLTGWTSAYTYPTTVVAGDEAIGVGPYDNVVFTFTDNGAEKSSIVGGRSNVVNGSFSFIGGGGGATYQYANTICNTADYSFIGAGQGNTIRSSGAISSFDQSSFVYTGTTAGTCTYYSIPSCYTTTNGAGTNACIDVSFCDNVPYCVALNGMYINYGGRGANYKSDDTITVAGAIFGGTTGVDDLTLSVYEVLPADNSAILGGCNNTLAVSVPSFIAGTGININQATCNFAKCGSCPVPALYINNLVFSSPNCNGGISTCNPYVCGQVFICNGHLVVSGF